MGLDCNLHVIFKQERWPVLLSVFGFALLPVLSWRTWMKETAMENEIYLLAAWFVVMM